MLDSCLAGFTVSGTGCNHFGANYSVGALIVGEWKLVKGPNGGEWTSHFNGTKSSSFGGVACRDHCIFNLTADPSEHIDLSAARPDVLATMLARFEAVEASYHPPSSNPPADDRGCCAAAAAAGNFLSPWTTSPGPSPGPPPGPPLGPCVGGAGSAGWVVLNQTGGRGPAFADFPAAGLGPAPLAACRARCCSTAQCVSVVLHEHSPGAYGCYLNDRSGTAKPYSRPATLLAYVNRSTA